MKRTMLCVIWLIVFFFIIESCISYRDKLKIFHNQTDNHDIMNSDQFDLSSKVTVFNDSKKLNQVNNI